MNRQNILDKEYQEDILNLRMALAKSPIKDFINGISDNQLYELWLDYSDTADAIFLSVDKAEYDKFLQSNDPEDMGWIAWFVDYILEQRSKDNE